MAVGQPSDIEAGVHPASVYQLTELHLMYLNCRGLIIISAAGGNSNYHCITLDADILLDRALSCASVSMP